MAEEAHKSLPLFQQMLISVGRMHQAIPMLPIEVALGAVVVRKDNAKCEIIQLVIWSYLNGGKSSVKYFFTF